MRVIPRRDLLAFLLVGVVLFVGMNLLSAYAARRLPPQELLQRVEKTAAPARFVFLGDGQMEAAADPVAFSSACAQPRDWRPSLNVGLAGTTAAEHCVILEHVLRHAPRADTVFYGFSDDQLTKPVRPGWFQFHGHRAVGCAFPERTAALLFPHNVWGRWTYRALARIPMFAQRGELGALVEYVRRSFGMRVAATTPARDPASFEREVLAVASAPLRFNHSTEELLRVSAARQLKFYFVLMPMPVSHRARYYSTAAWTAYRAGLVPKMNAAGGQFIDASAWLPDSAFAGSLIAAPPSTSRSASRSMGRDLSVSGARQFSSRLAQEVCPKTDAGAQP